mgnify:CR=1 FL=1
MTARHVSSDPVSPSDLKSLKEHYDRATDRFHQVGSAGGVLALEASGILPTRNFRDGSFEGARDMAGRVVSAGDGGVVAASRSTSATRRSSR